jgi:hypothetical protein
MTTTKKRARWLRVLGLGVGSVVLLAGLIPIVLRDASSSFSDRLCNWFYCFLLPSLLLKDLHPFQEHLASLIVCEMSLESAFCEAPNPVLEVAPLV